MAGRWRCLLTVAVVLGSVACSGDDDSTPPISGTAGGDEVTLDALAESAADTCPLPIAEAAGAADLEPAGTATGTVETPPTDTTAPTGNTLELPVLQRLDGVSVSCTLTLEGGTVDVLLVAGRLDTPGSAALSLLPALAREAALAADDLEPIAADLPTLDVGRPADLPGDVAVALVRTSVSGAADAALLVSSDDLDRPQVERIATELDGLLH